MFSLARKAIVLCLACKALTGCIDDAQAGGTRFNRPAMQSYVRGRNSTPQIFNGGAGSYTWNKPAGARYISIKLYSAGGGGGSGGAVASDSGGGSGADGWYCIGTFPNDQLADSVTITLGAGGAGGNGVAGGNGNQGGDPGSTSFGSLIVIDPNNGLSGIGGTNAVGTAGSGAITSITTVVCGTFVSGNGNGNSGDDNLAGTSGTFLGAGGGTPWPYILATSAGGGGGTNGGANFTAGGAGGGQNPDFVTGAYNYRAAPAGGAVDGGSGSNGADAQWQLSNSVGLLSEIDCTGGGGGAGSVLGNGGAGGRGGNCGCGGGGGGASLAGTSGAGGNGGDGCVAIWVW